MAVPASRIFWLQFCTLGEGGDVLSVVMGQSIVLGTQKKRKISDVKKCNGTVIQVRIVGRKLGCYLRCSAKVLLAILQSGLKTKGDQALCNFVLKSIYIYDYKSEFTNINTPDITATWRHTQ